MKINNKFYNLIAIIQTILFLTTINALNEKCQIYVNNHNTFTDGICLDYYDCLKNNGTNLNGNCSNNYCCSGIINQPCYNSKGKVGFCKFTTDCTDGDSTEKSKCPGSDDFKCCITKITTTLKYLNTTESSITNNISQNTTKNVKRNDTIEKVFNNIENVTTDTVTYEIIESKLELDSDNVTYYNTFDINNVNESDVDKDWEQTKNSLLLLGVIIGGIILLGSICICLSWLCHIMDCPVYTRTVTTSRDTHNSVDEFDEYCCCIPEWDNDHPYRHRRESHDNECIIC